MAAVMASQMAVVAFPPAPHHLVFGMVRDQLGNPIQDTKTSVIMSLGNSNVLSTLVSPGLSPGENFELEVPMDSGITSDLYQPTALLPAAPFRLRVLIGGVAYVPIEMKGNLAMIGVPGEKTRLDLTLGTSSDNDGLPDAWKRAVIQRLRLNISTSAIHPNDLFPGSGLTYYQVYVAGTYYMSPTTGFRLNISGMREGAAQLRFTGVIGRSYTIQASSGLNQWSPVKFTIPAQPGSTGLLDSYTASTTSMVQVEIPQPSPPGDNWQFYRLIVQ